MLCLCHKHFVEEKSIGNVQTERRKIEKRSNEGDAEKNMVLWLLHTILWSLANHFPKSFGPFMK